MEQAEFLLAFIGSAGCLVDMAGRIKEGCDPVHDLAQEPPTPGPLGLRPSELSR